MPPKGPLLVVPVWIFGVPGTCTGTVNKQYKPLPNIPFVLGLIVALKRDDGGHIEVERWGVGLSPKRSSEDFSRHGISTQRRQKTSAKTMFKIEATPIAQEPFAMDRIHSDVWMHILSFSNVIDACRIQVASKRFYYLVSQFQNLAAPQLAASSLDSPRECLMQLSRPPTLVLTFQSGTNRARGPPPLQSLAPGAILLGAVAPDVSSNIGNNVTTQESVMMASFPSETTNVTPFRIRRRQDEDECCLFQDGHNFQVIIIYVCGNTNGESILSRIQARYPTATIVGGICRSGWVTLNNVITYVNQGIFGVAGNIPVKSVVSRGVKSMLSSPWFVHEAGFAKPGDDNYLFVGADLNPYHHITAIRNENSTIVTSPWAQFARMNADFVGWRRPGADGFVLDMPCPGSVETNSIILMTDGSQEQEETLQNAELDLYKLDGDACLEHMDWTLAKLKKQTQDEVILGGIMFSCNGRGPEPTGLMNERMADATRFHNHFPEVPCLGFYAGGEIGPTAVVGREDVFQQGKASVQGFTAVFALFIVPVPEQRSYSLDDSDANVNEFVRSKLGATSAEQRRVLVPLAL